MKKKIFLILVIIGIIAGLIFVIISQNDKNQFKLDTEGKYKIEAKSKMEPQTYVAVTTYTKRYYEIDLNENKIEVRENSIVDNKSEYTRKLINSRILTAEETEELKLLLEGIMGDGERGTISYKGETLSSFKSMTYYLISNKQKKDIVMADDDKIDKFLEIVKLEL